MSCSVELAQVPSQHATIEPTVRRISSRVCCARTSAIWRSERRRSGPWIAPAPAGFQPTRTDVQVLRPAVARDRAHLEWMLALLDAGAVSPPAITRYKLGDAAEAHRVSEGRHLQGKLVFEIR